MYYYMIFVSDELLFYVTCLSVDRLPHVTILFVCLFVSINHFRHFCENFLLTCSHSTPYCWHGRDSVEVNCVMFIVHKLTVLLLRCCGWGWDCSPRHAAEWKIAKLIAVVFVVTVSLLVEVCFIKNVCYMSVNIFVCAYLWGYFIVYLYMSVTVCSVLLQVRIGSVADLWSFGSLLLSCCNSMMVVF